MRPLASIDAPAPRTHRRSPPARPPAAGQTAATLHDQTQQLNKVVDDLNEIEFTMKKATRVIADITKGIMTDKCAAPRGVGARGAE